MGDSTLRGKTNYWVIHPKSNHPMEAKTTSRANHHMTARNKERNAFRS